MCVVCNEGGHPKKYKGEKRELTQEFVIFPTKNPRETVPLHATPYPLLIFYFKLNLGVSGLEPLTASL